MEDLTHPELFGALDVREQLALPVDDILVKPIHARCHSILNR